jgi:hypothetical protein
MSLITESSHLSLSWTYLIVARTDKPSIYFNVKGMHAIHVERCPYAEKGEENSDIYL